MKITGYLRAFLFKASNDAQSPLTVGTQWEHLMSPEEVEWWNNKFPYHTPDDPNSEQVTGGEHPDFTDEEMRASKWLATFPLTTFGSGDEGYDETTALGHRLYDLQEMYGTEFVEHVCEAYNQLIHDAGSALSEAIVNYAYRKMPAEELKNLLALTMLRAILNQNSIMNEAKEHLR
jgi:hypothetical protein